MTKLQFSAGKEDLNHRFHLHTEVVGSILRLPHSFFFMYKSSKVEKAVVFIGLYWFVSGLLVFVAHRCVVPFLTSQERKRQTRSHPVVLISLLFCSHFLSLLLLLFLLCYLLRNRG